MKAKIIADGVNLPGHLRIEAENEQERLLLRNFANWPDTIKNKKLRLLDSITSTLGPGYAEKITFYWERKTKCNDETSSKAS